MPAQDIKVTLQPITRERNAPGEVAVEVTFTNAATEAATLDLSNAHIPSLALEIRDAAGRKIPMPPPPVPKAGDLRAAPVTLAPGQSRRIRLPVPFDARHSGAYQVRYRHREPAATRATLRTSAASDAITSDWMPVALEGRGEFRDLPATLQPSARIEQPVSQFNRFWCLLRCVIFLVWKKRCNKIASVEVDRTVTEVMTNDPRGDDTYSWNSRFLLSLDQPKCRITVTVRIRVTGAITPAQRTAWKTAIEAKWSNTFKLCCREGCCRGCCGSSGYAIVCDVQFVASGEHQVLAVGPDTLDMRNWSAADTVDVTHEFGHMLGNMDEYFTVNGTDFGPGRQAGGNIMNNPANAPIARHFDLIKEEAQNLIGAGTTCTVKGVAESC